MRVHFLLPSIFAWFLVAPANPGPLNLSSIRANPPILADAESAIAFAKGTLHNVTLYSIPAASAKIDQFIEAMKSVLVVSKNFGNEIERSAQKNLTADVSEKLSTGLDTLIVHKFDNMSFLHDKEARREERVKIVDWLMVEAEDILVRNLPLPEGDIRQRCQEIGLHVKDVLLITGELIDDHPIIFAIIEFGGFLLVPESWLLRPILGLFGFGSRGISKGSAAASLQRIFWGGAVRKGSWFAMLQSMGAKIATSYSNAFKMLAGWIGLG
ncbi:hypothetical protein FPV67DRAFT_1472795 [Lyophyllum atratum]|nr:hypothetical protein FPV67DRAFT_1472795 [Lyophyllum atratum]